jgi:hypothetical protein
MATAISWSFIVGKKPRAYSRSAGRAAPLQVSNTLVIHNLSTQSGGKVWDNMWAICGSQVDRWDPSRIVVSTVFDMPLIPDEVRRFYPKM